MKLTILICLFGLYILNCQTSLYDSSDVIVLIDTEAFRALMDTTTEYILIDVRTPPEIAQGKIGDALEMDVKNDNFASSVDQLDPEKTVLLYCRSGKRSSRAAKIFEQKGFKKIYNLKGGYLEWKSKYGSK